MGLPPLHVGIITLHMPLMFQDREEWRGEAGLGRGTGGRLEGEGVA